MRSILRLVVRDEAFGLQIRIVSALVITRDSPNCTKRFLLSCVYLHAIDSLRFGYATPRLTSDTARLARRPVAATFGRSARLRIRLNTPRPLLTGVWPCAHLSTRSP